MSWQDAARRAARRYGLPERYFIRQMGQEAHGDDLTSPAGAQGPAQIMPATARAWGLSPAQVHNRRTAYNAAAKHMDEYRDKYGNFRNALIAYNAGPGRVGGSLPAETQNYIATIMKGGPGHMGPGGPIGGGGAPSINNSPDTLAGMPTGQNPIDLIAGVQIPGAQENPYQNIMDRGWDLLSQAWDQNNQSSGPPDAFTKSIPGGDTGGPQASVKGGGTANFEGHTVAAWIAPALAYARKHGWKGEVNSGFRTLAEQQRIWDSGVRPAARPGTSNHEGAKYPRGAVDVSEAQQLSDILMRSPWRKRLIYAGSKDPVHFSHPHGGSY